MKNFYVKLKLYEMLFKKALSCFLNVANVHVTSEFLTSLFIFDHMAGKQTSKEFLKASVLAVISCLKMRPPCRVFTFHLQK